MNGYQITYPSGMTETVLTDESDTVDAFAASKFGDVDYVAMGTKVKKMSAKNVQNYIDGAQQEAEVAAGETTPAETLTQMATEMQSIAADAPASEKAKLETIAQQTKDEAVALADAQKVADAA